MTVTWLGTTAVQQPHNPQEGEDDAVAFVLGRWCEESRAGVEMAESNSTETPPLDAVMPGTKRALKGPEAADFLYEAMGLARGTCDEMGEVSMKVISSSEDSMNEKLDAIVYIDNALSSSVCEKLQTAVNASADLSFWSAAGREDEKAKSFRDADTIEVNSKDLAGLIWERIKGVVGDWEIVIGSTMSTHMSHSTNSLMQSPSYTASLIQNETFLSHTHTGSSEQEDPRWERELPGIWRAVGVNDDFLFARYPSGGHFAPHTDGRAIHSFNCRSFYSIIIFLNTIPFEKGGGTRFYGQEAVKSLFLNNENQWTGQGDQVSYHVEAQAGRCLIFSQELIHEGIPVLSPHEKFIIRSDVLFTRSPALCDSEMDREAFSMYRRGQVRNEQYSIIYTS